jgi:hypothetical protein
VIFGGEKIHCRFYRLSKKKLKREKNNWLQPASRGRHPIAHAQSSRTTVLGSRVSLFTGLKFSPRIIEHVTPTFDGDTYPKNRLVGGQSTQLNCLSLMQTRRLKLKGSIPITDWSYINPSMRFRWWKYFLRFNIQLSPLNQDIYPFSELKEYGYFKASSQC